MIVGWWIARAVPRRSHNLGWIEKRPPRRSPCDGGNEKEVTAVCDSQRGQWNRSHNRSQKVPGVLVFNGRGGRRCFRSSHSRRASYIWEAEALVLHCAVTGRKEGEKKVCCVWFCVGFTNNEEDKGQKIRRLQSCITGVWVVSCFLDSIRLLCIYAIWCLSRDLSSLSLFLELIAYSPFDQRYVRVRSGFPPLVFFFFCFFIILESMSIRSALSWMFCVFKFARLF